MASPMVVLILVFVLDLIAFALAVAAEQRRSTATIALDAESRSYCQYNSDIATGLGVGALVLLLISQLLVMAVTRCLCCGRGLMPGRSRTWAIVLFIFCWFTFFIAEVCLLAGSVRNAYHTKYRTVISGTDISCEMLRKGVFGAGAAFIVFTGILSELYYANFNKANADKLPYSRDAGVRMGPL